jgi:hypothetical protein
VEVCQYSGRNDLLCSNIPMIAITLDMTNLQQSFADPYHPVMQEERMVGRI